MLDPRIISVVAWDLDNTLFDRNGAFRRFFVWWLARRCPQQSPPERQARVEVFAGWDGEGGGDRRGFYRKVLAACGLNPDASGDLWAEVRAHVPDFIEPDERIAACLDRLRERYALALISNGGGDFQREKLRRAGLSPCFAPDRVFISGEVGFEKPDPRLFETALRAMGTPPERVLYVGDDPVNDVAGAALAGMRTCWVARGEPGLTGPASDAVVTHAGEVASLLLPDR